MPDTLFLVPGYGAQGGTAADALAGQPAAMARASWSILTRDHRRLAASRHRGRRRRSTGRPAGHERRPQRQPLTPDCGSNAIAWPRGTKRRPRRHQRHHRAPRAQWAKRQVERGEAESDDKDREERSDDHYPRGCAPSMRKPPPGARAMRRQWSEATGRTRRSRERRQRTRGAKRRSGSKGAAPQSKPPPGAEER